MIIAIRFPTYCKTHYRLFSLCVIPLLHARFAGGSCWAFSTAETWEDNACILGINGVNNETTFSTEDLLACATFGSGQCGGGRINYAFDYVVSDGLVDEKCFYGIEYREKNVFGEDVRAPRSWCHDQN